MIDYDSLSDDELNAAIIQIRLVMETRLLNRLQADDNTKVRTLRVGFSGYAGVVAYSRGLVRKGGTKNYAEDYYTFSAVPNGRVHWLVTPEDLFATVEIVPV